MTMSDLFAEISPRALPLAWEWYQTVGIIVVAGLVVLMMILKKRQM